MKRALLCGINYEGTSAKLRGCINDINLMERILLEKYAFDRNHVIKLTESQATRDNIVNNLENLVKFSLPGDTIYFHFSGHGSQVQSYNNDEVDGLDEVLVNYDYKSGKLILDDDLNRIFSLLKDNVTLICVHDCCHSGDSLRGELLLSSNDEPDIKSRFLELPMSKDIPPNLDLILRPLSVQILEYSSQKGILISGCRSNETSADAYFAGTYYGALTYCMCNILQQHNWNITYQELVNNLNQLLGQAGFTQHPELNCKEEYKNKTFIG
jgi:hypothetical protein